MSRAHGKAGWISVLAETRPTNPTPPTTADDAGRRARLHDSPSGGTCRICRLSPPFCRRSRTPKGSRYEIRPLALDLHPRRSRSRDGGFLGSRSCRRPTARRQVWRRPQTPKATPIRFTLQLLRLDDAMVTTELITPATGGSVPTLVHEDVRQTILASPIMTTLDGSTATISVAGGNLSYTLSLSPAIASNGKILTLWNLRLSGKSLPGATAVTATGATKIEAGKPSVIAEISLTDPVSKQRATFILQGITATGDAVTDNPPSAVLAPAPLTPPAIAPATP